MTAPAVALPSHPLPRLIHDRLTDGTDSQDLLAGLDILLADRRALHDWLRAVIDDPENLAGLLARSYWHANRFAKLVVYADERCCVRLHVWPSGPIRQGESDPHAHRWAFASTVLTGTGLRIIEYAESDTGEPTIRFRYDGYKLFPEEHVHLLAGKPVDITTHARYACDTKRVHTVEPRGDELVATLVVQGPHVEPDTVVYAVGPDAPLDRPRMPISEAAVRGLLGAVLAALEPGGDRST